MVNLRTRKRTSEATKAKAPIEKVPINWVMKLCSGIGAPDATGQGAEDTADTVNRHSTNRIVDLELVEEDDRENHKNTGNGTHKHGLPWIDHVGTGGDTDQTGEDAIESH